MVASVSGDIDGLGPDEFGVDTWLDFRGVTVQLSEVSSAAVALDRLAAFTVAEGLAEVDDPRGIAFRFGPR